MKTKSETFIIGKETPWENLGGGTRRQIMGYDGQIMAVKVEFEKGAEGTPHAHYHSQTSYVVSGRFEITINGESKILSAGDGFYVEPDMMHGAKCLEAGILLDIFTPHRSDFLKK